MRISYNGFTLNLTLSATQKRPIASLYRSSQTPVRLYIVCLRFGGRSNRAISSFPPKFSAHVLSSSLSPLFYDTVDPPPAVPSVHSWSASPCVLRNNKKGPRGSGRARTASFISAMSRDNFGRWRKGGRGGRGGGVRQ